MIIDTDEILTNKDVEVMFGVGQMSIWKWRKFLEMPEINIPGNARNIIRFDKPSILAWAAEHNKEIVVDVLTIKEQQNENHQND